MSASPGFDATLRATATRRYLATDTFPMAGDPDAVTAVIAQSAGRAITSGHAPGRPAC